MQRTALLAVSLATVVCCVSTAPAATAPPSMSHESMIVQKHMNRVSVGGQYEFIEREIAPAGRDTGRLRAKVYGGYLGFDLFHWLTAFGTLGVLEVSEVDVPGAFEDFDEDKRWSAGAHANLWHYDITEPDFMTGRLSIGVVAERAEYSISGEGVSLEWTETVVAVPVGYELPADESLLSTVHGLLISAGPIFSEIDGDYSEPGRHIPFDAEQEMGMLLGADAFLAENLTVGGQLQIFNKTTFNVGVRYHF